MTTTDDTVDINNEIDLIIEYDDMPFIQQPVYISDYDKSQLITKILSNILKLIDKMSSKNLKLIESGYALSKIISRRKQQFTGQTEKLITEEILWLITQDPYAPYYYGLMNNVLDSNLYKQLDWIITDYYAKYKYTTLSNSKIININFQELHRSGWQYIVNNIINLTSQQSYTQDLIFDLYVDKTFHWNKTFYIDKNIIPYTTPWVGFIHHTYSYYNNYYNCDVLFRDDDFITSLNTCKSLIVMSIYLKNKIIKSLTDLYNQQHISHIPSVTYIPHPSENTSITFNWDNFINNSNKQVIQIGTWLRNVHAIYQLELPTTSIIQQKSLLKNKNIDNYLPPYGFLDNMFEMFNTKYKYLTTESTFILDICKISFENMHLKGLYEYLVHMENSVNIIDYLDNHQYDVLLSQNIVFIQLVDASAVNTIIECILRNTPIIVNKIEPVVELLGPHYPLYYNTFFEASTLLNTTSKLHDAYIYLTNMDKTKFTITYFTQQFTKLITQITS